MARAVSASLLGLAAWILGGVFIEVVGSTVYDIVKVQAHAAALILLATTKLLLVMVAHLVTALVSTPVALGVVLLALALQVALLHGVALVLLGLHLALRRAPRAA